MSDLRIIGTVKCGTVTTITNHQRLQLIGLLALAQEHCKILETISEILFLYPVPGSLWADPDLLYDQVVVLRLALPLLPGENRGLGLSA